MRSEKELKRLQKKFNGKYRLLVLVSGLPVAIVSAFWIVLGSFQDGFIRFAICFFAVYFSGIGIKEIGFRKIEREEGRR